MKWISFLHFVLLISGISQAQNWQTVNQFDTNYFSAGRHSSRGGSYFNGSCSPHIPNTSLLRINYVIKVVGNGGDSSFYFVKTIRDTSAFSPSGECVDSASPSWLGSFMLRKNNGDEFFFNNYRDTIFIPTQSTTGSNWILAKDTAGNIFRGSIAAVGTLQVDGVLDSFKTISIQAYSGTTPIANPYNNKILQLSKAHGWLQVLDFFRFPNAVYYSDDNPVVNDSTQHRRLRKGLMYPGPTTENLDWKYAPGNEWISEYDLDAVTNPDFKPWVSIVTHDSVIAFSQLSPSDGVASFKTLRFWKIHQFFQPSAAHPYPSYYDSSYFTTTFHTDTVRSISSNPFISIENEDYFGTGKFRLNHQPERVFVQNFDSSHFFITYTDASLLNITKDSNCYHFMGYSAIGAGNQFATYLPGFGQTANFSVYYDHSGAGTDKYTWPVYIKIGTSVYGTKVDVTKLGVGETQSNMVAKISPNPASDFIRIAPASGSLPLVGSLYNITGQILKSITVSGSSSILRTDDIPAGLYFLQVSNTNERQTFKVLIQH